MSEMADRYHALNAEVFPWFVPQWQRVLSLFDQNRLPHALLLNGAPGIGKARLAESIAGYVMCHQPVDSKACGHCRSCELLASSGHPDLYYLQPDEAGKAIKVDQVRELTEFMQNTAQQGGYRVVVLEPAEAMNISAANALLKTLEEPGKDTLLILITHQLGQVLPTIKSRCQRLDCAIPSSEQSVPWLMAQLSIEEAEASRLLSVVHGAPLTGLAFKSSGQQALRADLLSSLRDMLRGRKTPIEAAEQFVKTDVEIVLRLVLGVLSDVARMKATDELECIRNGDMEKMIKGVAKNTTPDKIFILMDAIQEELLGLKRRHNPNKQLLLERIFLDWLSLIQP